MATTSEAFKELTAKERRKILKHENAAKRAKSSERPNLRIVLDMAERVAKDPGARRRKEEVGHAAMLLAFREHQKKNTAQGITQMILGRLEERRRRAGNLPDIEHPNVRQWRERLTTTDERAYLAHILGIDVTDITASLWWFAKSLSDLHRVDAYRDMIAAQMDEYEQDEKYEQKRRQKSENFDR